MDLAGPDSWSRWVFPSSSGVLVGEKAPEGHTGFYLITLPSLNNREQPGNLDKHKKKENNFGVENYLTLFLNI